MYKKTIVMLIIAVGFILSVNPISFSKNESLILKDVPQKRPQADQYCFDFAGVVPPEIISNVNNQGKGLKGYFDIDFVMAIIPSLKDGSITEYAAKLFSDWKIGESTQGKKGILILIAMKEQKVKIEVGYDLEHIYTDLYVAQVEREMLKEFLEQADWERGFLATIENFVERTYRMEQKGVDVKEISATGYMEYYSGGAGAMNVFDFGAALKRPPPQMPQELRSYFGAQPTPALAFERYFEFLVHNVEDHTVDLFSESSKVFFSHWRTSSGQRRSEAEAASGVPYRIRQKGRYAVALVPTRDVEEFIRRCPYFFIRTEKGWQIDINTMSRSIIMGGPTWHFMRTSHPYMFAFDDYLIEVSRYYPLSGQKAFLGLIYTRWDKGYNGYKITPEIDSPAEKAGIQDGDILTSIDGVKITEAYQDWEMMKTYNPGDIVHMEIIRNDKRKNIRVKLDEVTSTVYKFPYKKEEGDPWLGIYVGYSEPYERKIVEAYDSILYVVENSPAQRAGLKERDLVVSGDVLYSRDIKPGDRVTLEILRDLKHRMTITIGAGRYSPGKEGI